MDSVRAPVTEGNKEKQEEICTLPLYVAMLEIEAEEGE